MRFIYPFIIGSVLLQFVSFICIAILLQSERQSLGVLTVYSGDIFYIDLDKMHVTSESGKYDLTFDNFSHLSGWLDETTAYESNQTINYEITAVLESCQASVTPGGIKLNTFNFNNRDTISVMLDRTDDGTLFYNEY